MRGVPTHTSAAANWNTGQFAGHAAITEQSPNNESAADSLLEAFDQLLTLHRLKVPALLRKTLHSTNPIESLFSQVRDCEKNIKRYRNSSMSQRWLASVLLYAESKLRRIKGADQIKQVLINIDAIQHAPPMPRELPRQEPLSFQLNS